MILTFSVREDLNLQKIYLLVGMKPACAGPGQKEHIQPFPITLEQASQLHNELGNAIQAFTDEAGMRS
jgi:hypothetical protein